ncbi:hypothetical protein H072_11186 [Dactylellina haptotyla CBS 200.50]|uniref:Very-long-chain 3-oxoacyl-CoA reductase n=1 Tax=Dactylellina haptotyla (strain CBS 200.50) TaxID=1284197 RepID=S7ZXF6_DACHA|nr:hypothetical protein H072_11186 [Dactylellina haptotyla CBS 200.50]
MAITFDAKHVRLVKTGLAYFGGAVLLYGLFRLLQGIFAIFIQPGKSLRKFGPKGSWALVTGASDGIGKEYAYQLAANDFNIILISRTASKLEEIGKDLESKFSVQTEYLPIDFAANRDEDYKKIAACVDGKDIAILVNNVGKSHDIPTPFLITPEQEMKDIITINCTATLRVTQIVAPGMVTRKRGLILTMGSFAGLTPTSLLATYSGSKAFLSSWSAALAAELAPSGVHVDLVTSYLVASAMSKIRRHSMTIPSPKNFVKAALGKIGVYVGNTAGVSTPYWSHGVMHWALENLAGLGSANVIKVNKSMHEDIRKRALRKKEREAKKQ